MDWMNEAELHAYVYGKTLYAFEPDTLLDGANVTYNTDGTCTAVLPDGTTDNGVYALEGDTYWTRYENFRDGTTNRFRLTLIGDEVAQAYYTDGRRAFVQSPHQSLAGRLETPT